jgi:2-amino-4-hydroxy-6-hydroxymethyldihydropteridine diphosphokinase
MNRPAVIGVGSNIEPHVFVPAAIRALAAAFGPVHLSRFVHTDPIGRPAQSRYLNGAVLVRTDLPAERLQDRLRHIEDELGRVRTDDKYAPRTIDLDLVVYDGTPIDPDVGERPFLAAAVAELLDAAGDQPGPGPYTTHTRQPPHQRGKRS